MSTQSVERPPAWQPLLSNPVRVGIKSGGQVSASPQEDPAVSTPLCPHPPGEQRGEEATFLPGASAELGARPGWPGTTRCGEQPAGQRCPAGCPCAMPAPHREGRPMSGGAERGTHGVTAPTGPRQEDRADVPQLKVTGCAARAGGCRAEQARTPLTSKVTPAAALPGPRLSPVKCHRPPPEAPRGSSPCSPAPQARP